MSLKGDTCDAMVGGHFNLGMKPSSIGALAPAGKNLRVLELLVAPRDVLRALPLLLGERPSCECRRVSEVCNERREPHLLSMVGTGFPDFSNSFSVNPSSRSTGDSLIVLSSTSLLGLSMSESAALDGHSGSLRTERSRGGPDDRRAAGPSEVRRH